MQLRQGRNENDDDCDRQDDDTKDNDAYGIVRRDVDGIGRDACVDENNNIDDDIVEDDDTYDDVIEVVVGGGRGTDHRTMRTRYGNIAPWSVRSARSIAR